MDFREKLKDKKRIVIKIGSSSLTHKETGKLDLIKLEILVREVSDLRNQGKEVVLVSSGAIMVGKNSVGMKDAPDHIAFKQACAAIGQAKLMMIYQKLFAEYNQGSAQILITKETMLNDERRFNAKNTFEQLLKLGVIPIVNENDTVSTEEIEFGDNDTLSAVVTSVVGGDLLILLTDIDGLYTDDPHKNQAAKLITEVPVIDERIENMAKGAVTKVGTGGMATKIAAANIVTDAGADMVIVNSDDLNNLNRVIAGEEIGTLFLAHKRKDFNLKKYLVERPYFRKG